MANRSGPGQEAALADLLALAPAGDRARVAGIAAARPMMAARGTQLAREAHRAQSRFGKDNIRAQTLALKSARQPLRMTRVDTEFSRAQAPTPEQNPDLTVIWGRVSEDGKARTGVTVSARGSKGEVRGYDCTDAVGAFSMTVPGQGSIRLRVTGQDDAILYAGAEEIEVVSGRVFYRDIRLGEAPVDICPPPTDDPAGGGQTNTVKVPDLVGRDEAEAVRLLTAVGLRPGRRETVAGTEPPGQVIRQAPAANSEVERNSNVDIWVAARDDVEVPALTGLKIADARAALERAGLTRAQSETVLDRSRQGTIAKQDPEAGTRVAKGAGVNLTISLGERPASAAMVLDLATLDPRFERVRVRGSELVDRATRLGLTDRQKLSDFANATDAKVRDDLGLLALRDVQALKAILRDTLARTE
jgi:hypothetical protein